MEVITEDFIRTFEEKMRNEEKAEATIEKYIVSIRCLETWLNGEVLSKQKLLEYRNDLLKKKKAQTVNGEFTAINAYLRFRKLNSLQVNSLKVQRSPFAHESQELTETEYKRLLQSAITAKNQRLYLLMMTLGSTGIRISELKYITVDAIRLGYADICLKGKYRTILLPRELCKKLSKYIRLKNIVQGAVFVTKSGKSMDRSNIYHDMKKLCVKANVCPNKVFPHNFRHLFARSFYAIEKNLAHLADVLGHSRIETTRIYVAVSAREHEKIMRRMKLII